MYSLDFMTLPGWIALISACLVVVQLIMTLITGGLDLDLDFDGDASADFDMSSIVSPKGILHFLFGASWYLVLVQPIRENGIWLFRDWIISIIVGLVIAIFIILLYYWLSKLACEKEKESGNDLIGRTGYVYLNTGNGNYDINISISGANTIIQVTSESKNSTLKNGTDVVIKDYKDGIYFIS